MIQNFLSLVLSSCRRKSLQYCYLCWQKWAELYSGRMLLKIQIFSASGCNSAQSSGSRLLLLLYLGKFLQFTIFLRSERSGFFRTWLKIHDWPYSNLQPCAALVCQIHGIVTNLPGLRIVPGLRVQITLYTDRVQLFTLMLIRIQLFTLMLIRIQLSLLKRIRILIKRYQSATVPLVKKPSRAPF